jgi:hypothetical protein
MIDLEPTMVKGKPGSIFLTKIVGIPIARYSRTSFIVKTAFPVTEPKNRVKLSMKVPNPELSQALSQ